MIETNMLFRLVSFIPFTELPLCILKVILLKLFGLQKDYICIQLIAGALTQFRWGQCKLILIKITCPQGAKS